MSNAHLEEVNNKLLAGYHEYMAKIAKHSNSHISNSLREIKRFSRVTIDMSGKNFRQIEPADIDKFFMWMMSLPSKDGKRTMRTGTLYLNYQLISGLFRWMQRSNYIKESPMRPLFLSIQKQQEAEYLAACLDAKQIFQMRFKTIELQCSTLCETLLSTGMRMSELRQVRACDVRWGLAPLDTELDRPSPYVSATIQLRTALHQIKRHNERDVYVNVIAGKLLRRYMTLLNITGKVPLFPFSQGTVQSWLVKAGDGIFSADKHPAIKQDPTPTLTEDEATRDANFSDLTDSHLADLPPDFAAYVRGLQERSQRTQERFKSEKELDSPMDAKDNLHPHGLRHTFCNIQWYRTYTGRRAEHREVSLMMGHRDIETTKVYLDRYQAVSSDDQWKRLMLGTRNDYIHQLSQDSIKLHPLTKKS